MPQSFVNAKSRYAGIVLNPQRLLNFVGAFGLALIAFSGIGCARLATGVGAFDDENMNQKQLLAPGIWGGKDIRLTVGEKVVSLEYPCAAGEIPGRIQIDSHGDFAAAGTHRGPRGGPARRDENSNAVQARYEGRIKDGTMNLTVTLSKNNEVIGNFELKLGAEPQMHRCM